MSEEERRARLAGLRVVTVYDTLIDMDDHLYALFLAYMDKERQKIKDGADPDVLAQEFCMKAGIQR